MNLLGLLFKSLYYRHLHPWIKLSVAFNSLKTWAKLMIGIIGFLIFAGLLGLAFYRFFVQARYASGVYTLLVLIAIAVSYSHFILLRMFCVLQSIS